MRSRVLLAAAGLWLALGLVSASTAEAGCWRNCAPRGWGHERTVVHYGYYPRYHHVYANHYATDPYAYRYEPRGYYPYYNSGYWRPAHEMRARGHYIPEQPAYYAAWGYPDRAYSHHRWHARHHGRHRHHHW